MKAQDAAILPTDVYLSLVSSLFGNRGTLFTGMVVHILSCFVIFAYTSSAFYLWLAAVFAVVFAYRLYWFRCFDQVNQDLLSRREIHGWEVIYVYGAAATALLLGIASGYAVLVLNNTFAAFMCIAVTMASMVSIVGRNYGSSLAVNLQTLGCCVPIVIACLLTGDVHLAVMSLFLVPFGLTTRSMANGVRDFLCRNVVASLEMARLAERFDIALTTISHGLMMTDGDHRIQVLNRRARSLLGLSGPSAGEGADLLTVLGDGLGETSKGLVQMLEWLEDGATSHVLVPMNDGTSLEFSVSRRSDGGVVLVFEDVTARIAADEKIRHMARFDALTQLPNGQFFRELVEERLESHPSEQAGLLLLDIEGFRHVNDLRGHRIGDDLLMAIAARLIANAGDGMIVARMIGDQFAVLAAYETEYDFIDLLGRLHKELQGNYVIGDHRISVIVNGGYVASLSGAFDMEGWRIKADLALNHAKLKGNGTLVPFRPEMDTTYVEEQKLKADLRQALQDEDLNVAFQPMYSLDGSRIECCEVLIRWEHPQKGLIAPDILVPLAEEMGLVSQISRFIIDRACRECAGWSSDVAVSVNLSVNDLHDDEVIGWVSEALSTHGLPAGRLHVEVTESFFMEEPTAVCEILEQLRAMGVTISIDDFGTGFSSLSYLDSLPLDIVKIDRAFIRDIDSQPTRVKLLGGIVHLARELGFKIVIEGVETPQQLALIEKHRFADLVQGYIFSPPISSQKLCSLLAEVECRKEAIGNA